VTASDFRQYDYISHMIEAIELARGYVEGMDKATFLADRRTQQAVIMNILIIGEAATKLADRYPEFTLTHSQIAWNSMRGMRNRPAHGYFDINMDVVWETLERDLPGLHESLTELRQQFLRDN